MNFLNKNIYRRYPVRATSSLNDPLAGTLPDSVITDCKLTTTVGDAEVYLQQVTLSGNYITVTVASTQRTLGVFRATVTQDYQTVSLEPFIAEAAGTLTLGLASTFNFPETHLNFEPAASQLEACTVFCFTPPGVKEFTLLPEV